MSATLSTAEQVIILKIKIRGLIVNISVSTTLLIYPKADIPRQWTLAGYVVYLCKMPAIVEGFKKIRVAFFQINDWINDCICNLNLIFYSEINISDVARFFCKPRNGRRLTKQTRNE